MKATGNVVETLRKYGVNDSLYYRWKEKYYGVVNLRFAGQPPYIL